MSLKQKGPDRAEVERLLGLLADELASRGQRASSYVFVRTNIVLAINRSRTTTDIHALVQEGSELVADAVSAVAKREPAVAADWIDAAFTGGAEGRCVPAWWFGNEDPDEPRTLFSSDALVVESASAEMMLALKTLAGGHQNLADAHNLMRTTSIRTPEGLLDNLKRFAGARLLSTKGTPGKSSQVAANVRRIAANAPSDLKVGKRAGFFWTAWEKFAAQG